MPYIVADRVKETSTSTGTGNFTLAGAATGFRTFSAAIGNGNTTTYVITDATGSQWEIGLGTLSGGTTLARTSVFSNSSGNTSPINFSAGTKSVFVSMSAAPRNNNVVLGTNLTFTPQTYQLATVVGYGATGSSDSVTAIGSSATASGQSTVAVGESSAASGAGAIAIGSTANASGQWGVAIGDDAAAAATASVAVGFQANANSTSNGGIAVGAGSASQISSTSTSGIAVGNNATSYGGIVLGNFSASGSGAQNSTVIGHGITAAVGNATYMNRFRTGVTPTGTAWALTWDDATNEVYAAPSGPPPANWYEYQTQPSPGGTYSVAMPSGMPTTSFGGGNVLFSTQATFSGSPSPSGSWSYNGFTGYYTDVYSAGSPQSDPTSYTGSAFGTIVVYYSGYETDSGTSSTVPVNTGTSVYSNTASSIYCSGFSPFGTTRYGHAIVLLSGGNYVGSITPSAGVTLVEEFYDSDGFQTFAFFDLDTTAVGNVGGGGAIATIGGSTAYETIFWYNYS
jgi:hypothetical protein